MSRSGIVNVRMVITEEKMLSNIDKVQKLINPKSKKQIIQLDDDTYFKDLIESIKTYLVEYPKKKNFPASVYKAAYGLVEFATNQFEENTKQIEELIRQREANIGLAGELKEILEIVTNKEEGWKQELKEAVELPITHGELYKQIGIDPPRGVLYMAHQEQVKQCSQKQLHIIQMHHLFLLPVLNLFKNILVMDLRWFVIHLL